MHTQPAPVPPQPAPSAPAHPWDQQAGEPDLWYGRFQVFLQLGPARTVAAARRHLRAASASARLCGNGEGDWSRVAARWQWRPRAAAWDASQRDLLALAERNLRLGLRERRIQVMEDTLEAIRTALDTADIANADQQTAREWLPQLRVFLRDMLVAERQEFERLDFVKDDPAAAAAITADDLRAAQRQLESAPPPPVPLPVPLPVPALPAVRERTFLICVRRQGGLMLDLAVLRTVRAATGLQFQRLLDPTRRKFAETLRRQRGLGHPIQYIHFALHAAAEGLEFADGPVDGSWLSEHLGGVRIALLASCASEGVGDWLGVVPYVISLSEDIAHEDAAALAQHFWHAIGLGHDPAVALDEALAHCPPAVAEYVIKHW